MSFIFDLSTSLLCTTLFHTVCLHNSFISVLYYYAMYVIGKLTWSSIRAAVVIRSLGEHGKLTDDEIWVCVCECVYVYAYVCVGVFEYVCM